jgi:MoaA/NifB/PqqE/SkfB family radical SAM enzyme
MCGQRGKNGYYSVVPEKTALPLDAWKKTVNEISEHKGSMICIRGGEPFLYPGITELLAHIKKQGIFISVDTNGTLLERHAEYIVNIGVDNINISVDGPEKIHDSVRGVKGSFQKIKNGIAKIHLLEKKAGRETCIKNVVFTISQWSYKWLAQMADVARKLNVPNLVIVPCIYFDRETGRTHETVMEREFSCKASSWKGFLRNSPGIDTGVLVENLKQLRKNANGVNLAHFAGIKDTQYKLWFKNCHEGEYEKQCTNPWKLIDIQPDGSVNFCIDFPDYTVGNIKDDKIEDIWKSENAVRFRRYLKKYSLPVCGRCVAKYV